MENTSLWRTSLSFSPWLLHVRGIFATGSTSATSLLRSIMLEDVALIKSMGFDHVRFPIAPEPILNPASPGQLPADYMVLLDRTVQALTEYRDLNWNFARYEAMIGKAVAGARERGIALTSNEFGVYKVFAPRACRLHWIRDVSGALARNQIGWTMWDYAGDFEVVNKIDGKRVPDREVLTALGF